MQGTGPLENDNCGFDNTDVPSDNVFSRGKTIRNSWVFNNHWNGFARFAIVPLGQEKE